MLMADTDNDILELKFDGNGINPSKVKPSEIALLINEFEKALTATIKANYPSVDTNEVLFSFETIRNESIGLGFVTDQYRIPPPIKDMVVGSYLEITNCIANNDYSYLTNDAITSLRKISGFSKKYKCNANFKHNGENITYISPTTEIKFNKPNQLKGDATIYGELLDVGGENPNIHIKVNDDYVLIIDTNKDIAKHLGTRLFDIIGLKGNAKWDTLSSKIVEFKLYEVLDYQAGNVKKTFNELKDIFSDHWDQFNSNDEINNQLFRD